MRCQTVQERLVAWQDGELAPGEAVRVEEHLHRCPDCVVLEQKLAAATPEPFVQLPPLSFEDQRRLSEVLDRTEVDAPALMWRPELDLQRLVPHVLWAAAVMAVLAWGLGNHFQAQALQAQIDAAPAPAPVVLDGADFRPASWAPPETDSEPGQ